MIYELRTVHDVASVVRGRRSELKLSQSRLAELAGLSRKWVYEFEGGKSGVELGNVLAVFEALGLRLAASPLDPSASATSDLDVLLEDYTRS